MLPLCAAHEMHGCAWTALVMHIYFQMATAGHRGGVQGGLGKPWKHACHMVLPALGAMGGEL